jgi:hypothetical protein
VRIIHTQTWVTCLGYRIRESDKAVLFKVHQVDGEEVEKVADHWFPLSQMKSQVYSHEANDGDMDTITVSQWILEQKGLL